MECMSSIVKTVNMTKNAAKNGVPSKAVAEINNEISDSDMYNTMYSSNVTYEAMADVAFMHDAKFSSTNSSIISALVPKMENLEVSQKTQPDKCLAGYVKAVILPSGTAVVQLASGSRILDVGTAIFLRNHNKEGTCKKYDEIGVVSDIFGSVLEPMYSLQLKERVIGESLKMDAEVFYSLHEHPSTKYISVVLDAANRYTVVQE
ncbi:hypothetical protein TSAR_006485 [Trichomalopsis sarcophagae]|uniref:H/ACA ribonucleoprotein complex subunit n=1 Tax=Trichomalopsis sarcophagae TaxID=543379 RepID=A0A232FKR1_9HYME|nr:hypothetical protein TSAR_006485 [Trichomalopsis sarcophagae]